MKLAPSTGNIRGAALLVDLHQRCAARSESGCWIWLGACTSCGTSRTRSPSPTTWFPELRRLIPAARAAWLLAGFQLDPSEVVFRYTCSDTRCIHPLHGAAGTRSDLIAHRTRIGSFKADGPRMLQLTQARQKMMTPRDIVSAVEARLGEDVSKADVAREFSLAIDTVLAIAKGRHPFSQGRSGALRGSSVFSLGAPL